MVKFLLLAHMHGANAPCADASDDSSAEDIPIKNTSIHFDGVHAEDIPIKNTFIHFDVPRECKNMQEAAMPRHRSAPLHQGCSIPRGWCEASEAKLVEDNISTATVGDDASTLASEGSLCRLTTIDAWGTPMVGEDASTLPLEESLCRWTTNDEWATASVGEDAPKLALEESQCRWTTKDACVPAAARWVTGDASVGDDASPLASEGGLCRLVTGDEWPDYATGEEATMQLPDADEKCPAHLVSEKVPAFTPSTLQVEQDDAGSQAQTSIWLVDGRRLKGRDTRVSSVLRPQVAGGPTFAELVVSIFPLPVSSKRGGACFKAANGIGRIQLKCNNPVDKELSVCITVGSAPTRCQKHNFASNPLMTFNGDWDFKASIDPSADRPTVAVILQLLEVEEGAVPTMLEAAFTTATSAKIDPAIMDPAIVAVGPSKSAAPVKSAFPSEAAQLKVPACNFGEFTPSTTPSQTPEVTPRSNVQHSWSPPTPQVPSPSPFFSLGDSVLFNFTIRRADGVELGLRVERDEMYPELIVQHVIPNGAAEAWNRQCFAGPFSSKAIVPTDRIVGINGRCDCQGMLEECRERQLLKIFVVRGELPHTDIPLGWCGVPNPSPTIYFVAVPVCFTVPCVKHDMVECHGGHVAASPDHFGGGPGEAPTLQALHPGLLRACAPEFIPPGSGQDNEIAEGVDRLLQCLEAVPE